MKAIVLDGKRLILSDVAVPDPGQDEALIRILYAGICNTDLELARGYMDYQGILGHEFVGIVEKANQPDLVDRRVVGEINIGCGLCSWCRKGLERHCIERSVLGILNKSGVMTEYISLPVKNLHTVAEELSDECAVFVEPLAAAFEISEQLQIEPDQEILILGDGKLGQLIARVLRLTGAEITVTGKHTEKLQKLAKYGIKTNQNNNSILKSYPVVIEATGSAAGLQQALRHVAPRGTVILKSTTADRFQIDLAPLVINEVMLLGSRCGPFAPALRALQNELVAVEDLITGIYDITDFQEAFALAQQPGSLKVLIKINPK